MNLKVIEYLDEKSWQKFVNDPLPGWGCRSFSLFDSPQKKIDYITTEELDYGVFSVPFDSTSSSRVGSRYGSMAIRQASLAYSSMINSRRVGKIRHMRTGELLNVKSPSIADYGDMHVYPSDIQKQIEATIAESFKIAMNSKCIVFLGGEHSLTFASFCGVHAATKKKDKNASVGYVQIDHHFDFGNNSVLHGAFYQGSNARRISELDINYSSIGFVGVGDITSATQYNELIEKGISIQSMADIRQKGFRNCLEKVLAKVNSISDYIYLSIDIDVCDMSTAPGTGSVTVGGINSEEFLSIASIIRKYPIIGLDIMEVAPNLDPSGKTERLSACLLFEWLYLGEE